jgi:hypothetical protein
MYYPYELMEKFDLSLEDITALIQKKMLKETFTDCYRIEYKSK